MSCYFRPQALSKECLQRRSLKLPCMSMSRQCIVPTSSCAWMNSGSRTSCVMWQCWWRGGRSVPTGQCWQLVASISPCCSGARRNMSRSSTCHRRWVSSFGRGTDSAYINSLQGCTWMTCTENLTKIPTVSEEGRYEISEILAFTAYKHPYCRFFVYSLYWSV